MTVPVVFGAEVAHAVAVKRIDLKKCMFYWSLYLVFPGYALPLSFQHTQVPVLKSDIIAEFLLLLLEISN